MDVTFALRIGWSPDQWFSFNDVTPVLAKLGRVVSLLHGGMETTYGLPVTGETGQHGHFSPETLWEHH